MRRITYLFLFNILSICGVNAQSDLGQSTIKWMSSRNFDLNASSQTTDVFTITTSPSKIEVTHLNRSKDFKIVTREGTLNDFTSDGKITYSVKMGDKNGKIILECFDKQHSITVDFSAYKDGMKKKFIIDNYHME